MRKMMIAVLLLSSRLFAQVPVDWCHGITNVYHCGLPDERVPFVVANVRMPSLVPQLPPVPQYKAGLLSVSSYTICVKDVCKSFDKETYEMIMQMGLDMARDMSRQRQREVRSGDDAELAALGNKVDGGTFSMGHVCINKQRYTFTIGLQDRYTDITFICLNDATHLELSAPRIHNYKNGKLGPYTGGPTWTNIR